MMEDHQQSTWQSSGRKEIDDDHSSESLERGRGQDSAFDADRQSWSQGPVGWQSAAPSRLDVVRLMGRRFTQTDLPEVIPVFPLPGALLLPRGRLPLNLF